MAAMPIYGKNLKKSSSPEPRMPWSWIFAQIIRNGRSIKVAKRIVVRWHLTFLLQGQCHFPMHLYEPHPFEWENCWEFQTTSPLNNLSQFCSVFIWSHLRVGKQKIAKIIAVHWPRWWPCPYMVKTFKKLLLQNQECLGTESLHKSLETRGLPKLLKEFSWHLTFLWQGQVCFPMHLYEPHTFECENFKELLLWSQWAKFAQISYWAFLGLGNKRLLKWLWFLVQGGRYAHIWWNPSKFFFSRT